MFAWKSISSQFLSSVMILSLLVASQVSLGLVIDADYAGQTNGLSLNWTVETVDDEWKVGAHPTIVLGPDDVPRVIYEDYKYPRIKMGERVDSKWNLSVVKSRARWPTATVDSKGRYHLTFLSMGNNCPNYGVGENGSWDFEVIREFPFHMPESIVTDSLDMPHIGGISADGVFHIFSDGTTWKIEEVERRDETSGFDYVSLDADRESNLHMAYLDFFNFVLRYAFWNGLSWRVERVDDLQPSFTSIAVTSDGEPHILYRGLSGVLRHAVKMGNSWTVEELPFAKWLGVIVIDSHDRMHLAFTHDDLLTLGYAYHDGNSWRWDIIEEAKAAGEISLAIDSKGNPHMSYYKQSADNLRYVTVSEPRLEATVDIDPDTLNLKSKGKFITAYIELEGADVRDIDASSIKLNDIISPVLDEKYGFVTSEDSYIVDHDEDGVPERMVKFWRSEIQDILDVGPLVTITLSGTLVDGSLFEGTDEIRVIDLPRLNQQNTAETGLRYRSIAEMPVQENVGFPSREYGKSETGYGRVREFKSSSIRLQFQDNPIIR
jgi:hypothetical protein